MGAESSTFTVPSDRSFMLAGLRPLWRIGRHLPTLAGVMLAE